MATNEFVKRDGDAMKADRTLRAVPALADLCFDHASRHEAWGGEGFAVVDSFAGLSEPGAEDLNFAGPNNAERERLSAMTRAGLFACDYKLASCRIWSRFTQLEIHRH